MDPNQTLKELREWAEGVLSGDEGEAEVDDHSSGETRAAELFEALDGWLSKGGFLPREWQRGRP